MGTVTRYGRATATAAGAGSVGESVLSQAPNSYQIPGWNTVGGRPASYQIPGYNRWP